MVIPLILVHHEAPSAAAPQPKFGISRAKTQRREGKTIPNLAFLAPWREQIPILKRYRPPKNLRKLRKLSSIVVRRSRSVTTYLDTTFADLITTGSSGIPLDPVFTCSILRTTSIPLVTLPKTA